MAGLLQELISLICIVAVGCAALTVDRFIPFGTAQGDTIFFSNDDNTTSIAVPVRFPFHDRLFTAIHINNNGLLSFEAPVRDYTPRDFPLKADNSARGVGVAFIAPFWADVDTRDGHGTVFFRSTTNLTTLALIKDVVSNSQAGADLAARFNPKWALVATWEEVGYYDRKGDMQNNTFQVVVVTDGLFSFTVFNYAKLTWITGDASRGTNGFGGTAAMVGINAGGGVNFKKFQHSLTDRVVEVLEDSNMVDCNDPALKGQYVYQIDTVPLSNEKNCKDPSRPISDLCLPATIRMSPSFGAVHTGGFVIVTGPNSFLFNGATAARIKFGDNGEELKCDFQARRPIIICPVPLFPPDGTGMKVVTLTLNSFMMCTYKGQYRVDPPQPFVEGNLMMTEEDDLECGRPLSKPVLDSGARFCLTWNASEHFARDQVAPFQNDNIEVNVTMHYLSPDTSLPNHEEESGWKTIDLDRLFSVELHKESTADFRPHLIDEAAIVTLDINVQQITEFRTPVPVLMFFKVSIIGANINVFSSSPLVSFIPKSQPSLSLPSAKTQCDNIIPSLEEAHDRLPCPATLNQAFLDPSLVVDSGCLANPAHPNKLFNCHLNPGAQQCFQQRNTSRSDDSIVGQCCYKNDVLETTLVGGRDTKSDPKTNFFEHFSKDVWPIMVCCEEILIANDEICMKILNEDQRYFARSFATGYSAPQVGFLFPIDGTGKDAVASSADLLTQSTLLIAPLNLTELARERLLNASLKEKLYICYRMHGEHGRTFNLVSDTWISINVQYYINIDMTYISAVGITLLDNDTAQCIRVGITADQCSTTINGETVSASSLVIGQYQFQFTSTDKSLLISRQGRPNRFSPVVRVSCVPSSTSVNQNNLYLHVSDALPQSHGILGQLWNVPADVQPLSCGSHDLSVVTGRQIYEAVLHPNTAKERAIVGAWYPLTWSLSHPGPCIYAGDWFAGPNIIEDTWQDYKVAPENDLFSTDFMHSKFPRSAFNCSIG